MAASSAPLNVGTSRKYRKSLLYLMIFLLIFLISTVIVMLYPNSVTSLIKEPVNTLKIWCLSYGALVLCGYNLLSRMESDLDASSASKRSSGSSTFLNHASVTVVSSIKYGLLLFFSSIAFHIVAVLYGAPFTETVTETAMFGVLLTTLVTLPTLCVLGTNLECYSRLIGSRRPHPGIETCLAYIVVFSLLGAWLGAFPIPLDWDRPWQKWPVSCSIGALSGHTLGLTASVIHSGGGLGDSSETFFGRSKSKNY
ncbi:phosphatidylinositol-glycan biosynthesis class F protein [Strongylocentrotus purpuratus]|uniref:Phosphatidylinositol-glycan biosynthesis class F protein n=1 Tax=Strongylocentrotus purpuratus TaxID=7668 RepID=A0A7M7G9N3_STRPU|nr:phosphatidylinositol-glycan biosynthesis class F protein [Strongylocentrotus purpuratus]|eukprot:XP_001187877.2 PREDICTED: phosphatidylinositol-glycan biosynthesis class F protein [Strongylocentrotus purpuratus]